MDKCDIILSRLFYLKMSKGKIVEIKHPGSVYHFEGNIYRPLQDLPKTLENKIDKAIQKWLSTNRDRINAERAKPTYKSLLQLADEQWEVFGNG